MISMVRLYARMYCTNVNKHLVVNIRMLLKVYGGVLCI